MRDEVLGRRQIVLLAVLPLACGPATTSGVPVVTVAGSEGAAAVVEPSSTADGPPAPKKLGPIAWETSELDARERAKLQKRPLVVFVFAEWAAAATRMDRLTWSDPRVIERVRSFVPLRIDLTEADVNAQAGADTFDLKTMPSTVVFDDLGHEMARLEGFAGPEEVLSALTRLEMVGD